MRKQKWKVFEMDDCTTVAARTWQEAVVWFCNYCGVGKEDIFYPPVPVDTKKQYMAYDIAEIPSQYRQRRVICNYEGQPCVEITLKKALKYQLKLHKYKEPFIICASC